MLIPLALPFVFALATRIQLPGEELIVTLPRAHRLLLRQPGVMDVIWSEDRLIALVSLDVWDLPGEPLRAIAATDQWPDAIKLTLLRSGPSKRLPVTPRLLRAARGGKSPPVISLHATYDLGTLSTGDYELEVRAGRSLTAINVAVRSGSEPETRDSYLRDKAETTHDYASFRKLELERLALDPTRTDAASILLQRSLNEGTETEIRTDIDRILKGVTRPIKPMKDPWLRSLLLAQTSVPDLIEHRPDWTMSFDSEAMAFVIYSRAQHAVIRTFR